MTLLRQFELAVQSSYKSGRMPGFVHLYIGQEAVATGVCAHLRSSDWITSTHRGHGHALAKGEQHPYPRDHPSYVASSQQIVSISNTDLRNGGKWWVEGEINPPLTGLPRNHNAGIERTLYGMLPHYDSMRLIFTNSCASSECGERAEWSYDLWEIRGQLPQW